mmetsp:Transcript_11053/g.27085  ORF Transcript_11053/g.27085 Transcript_11053/m.27085 type:complete len:259 (-) Transcript_11053:1376-2152(-)
MIDDLSGVDDDADLLGEALRIGEYGHVEGQDARVRLFDAVERIPTDPVPRRSVLLLAHLDPLALTLEHHAAAHHVVLRDRPNANARHRDRLVGLPVTVLAGPLEELEEGLEGSEGRRLHIHTILVFADFLQDTTQVLHHLLPELVLVVILAEHAQIRTRESALDAGGADLDADGPLDLLVVHVGRLDTHLLHRLRGEERPDLRDDGPVEAAHDDGLLLLQATVDDDNVHRCTKPLNGLDLEHSALEILVVHNLVDKHL